MSCNSYLDPRGSDSLNETDITKEDKRHAKRTPRPMETGAIYKQRT